MGINIILLQLLILIGLALFVIGFVALAKAGIGPRSVMRSIERMLVSIVLYTSMAASIVGIVGKSMCLWVPKSMRGREFIVLTIALEFISFTLGVLDAAGIFRFAWIGHVVGYLAMVMFLWFLSELSLSLDRRDLEETAGSIVNLGLIAIVILGLLWIPGILLQLTFVLFLAIIPLVMIILMFVRYVALIFGLRAALSSKRDGAR